MGGVKTSLFGTFCSSCDVIGKTFLALISYVPYSKTTVCSTVILLVAHVISGAAVNHTSEDHHVKQTRPDCDPGYRIR
jgi:hypothetical protein